MSVEVRFKGQLGNNMFQYAIGRIIAEHHRFELDCRPRAVGSLQGRRSNNPPSTLAGLAGCFPSAPLFIPGTHGQQEGESFIVGETPGFDGYTIDLNRILANREPRRLVLSGYFQRYEYLRPYCKEVRQWFSFDAVSNPYTIGAADVLINFRRGLDYAIHDWLLPLTYYKNTLESLEGVGRIYICGTDIDERIRREFARYNPIYYDGSPMEHMSFFQQFERIILSNSTFAWWAGFLSNASTLYAPIRLKGGPFGFRDDQKVDLNLHEPCYIEIGVDSKDRAIFITVQPALAVLAERLDCVDVEAVGDRIALEAQTIDADDRSLIRWLAAGRRSITIDDMREQYPTADVSKVAWLLVHARALRLDAAVEGT